MRRADDVKCRTWVLCSPPYLPAHRPHLPLLDRNGGGQIDRYSAFWPSTWCHEEERGQEMRRR